MFCKSSTAHEALSERTYTGTGESRSANFLIEKSMPNISFEFYKQMPNTAARHTLHQYAKMSVHWLSHVCTQQIPYRLLYYAQPN